MVVSAGLARGKKRSNIEVMRGNDEKPLPHVRRDPRLKGVRRRVEVPEAALLTACKVVETGREEVIGLEDLQYLPRVGIVERFVAQPPVRQDLRIGEAHSLGNAGGGHARTTKRARGELHVVTKLPEQPSELPSRALPLVSEGQGIAERRIVRIYLRAFGMSNEQRHA